MDCRLCKAPMTKTGTLNSGNSQFQEYTCKTCNEQKTVCAGINT